jgi:DNA-binding IclR family transcriptional regulator
MTDTQYTNEGQQRILRLLRNLAGHEITGISPGQLAQSQECSPALITRDLANLKQAGFAEQVPETQLWRLSPELVQISLAHGAAMNKAQRRLDEVQQRFTQSY